MKNKTHYYKRRYVDGEVSLTTFCNDCLNNPVECKKNVSQCIKEAKAYRKFVKIKELNN